MRVAAWFLLICSALSACASDCERFRELRNTASSPCSACRTEHCAGAGAAYAAAPAACAPEFACAARCPDRSSATCGCIESCLPTTECRAALDAVIACDVQSCASACQ